MCDLLNMPEDAAYHCVTYGINHFSPLNNLQYYYVCDFGLPPDVMHELLEGYVPYIVKLMLKYCIDEKNLFSLDEVNTHIKCSKYGYIETKSTPIFPSTFSQSNPIELNQSGKIALAFIPQ